MIKMKKAIILFLALSSAIAYVTDMQAQTTERQDAVGKFRIVPAVMLTFNPYSVDDGRNNSVITSHNVQLGLGVEAEYRMNEVLGVASGVDYIVQGIKISKHRGGPFIGLTNGNDESEDKLKSLRVPLMLCMHPMDNDRLTIKTGVQAEFLLGMGERYKNMSWGMPLGIDYSVDDKFQFELRFCAGITDVVKDKCSVSRNCIILSAGIRL